MTTIFVRLSNYACGEFLSAHATRDSALAAWAKHKNCHASTLTSVPNECSELSEDIYYKGTRLGSIVETPLNP